MRLKKYIIIIPLLLFLLGFIYSLSYTANFNRVINAIDFNNEVYSSTSLKYRDLSTNARKYITKEEFDKWNAWQDIEKSFLKFNNQREDADFIFHGRDAVICIFYQKSITGYKINYLEFHK
uniref:DUF3139 domain-containing protein n=1 Tax=Anaerobacillus isosaccharinicus TaxID=1532552 RepID=A0A1S2M8Y9_9BACI